MSGLLARMEASGLVRRAPSPASRRSVEVHLSPAGRTLFERLRPAVAAADAAVEARLRAGDLEALQRVVAAFSAATTPPGTTPPRNRSPHKTEPSETATPRASRAIS